MHASAQTHPAGAPVEADLFPDAAPGTGAMLEFTGILKTDAQVRTKPVGDGLHVLPVLCLDLGDVGAGHHILHAEQIYTEATRHHAEAKAKTLKKGALVRVRTSVLDMRIFLPHVEHVQLDAPPHQHH